MGLGDERHAAAALSPAKRGGNDFVGRWVDPWPGLDV